jgi:radical SAM protein with 4Fe4S-binding SPASM domain
MGMRILPLFAGPDERPKEDFLVEHSKIVAALERLFRHWVETGCKVPIRPLDLYFQSALRNMVGLQVPHLRRGQHGDGVVLVNVDGSVYRVGDAYEQELSLGSIARQSIDELLESPEYAASIQRDVQEYAQHCESCEYRVGCMGGFIYDTRPAFEYEGSCVTAWHCIRFMQKFIREQGYSEADIKGLLPVVLKARQVAAATVSV